MVTDSGDTPTTRRKIERDSMDIQIGIDTLCYHCRLAEDRITVESVLQEAAGLGADFVQVNAVHIAQRNPAQLGQLRATAERLGLGLTLSGDIVGVALRKDTVEEGAARVGRWVKQAQALGSPFARFSSGFYRSELWREPAKIAAEQRYIIDTLRRASEANTTGIRLLLENHSDFTPEEYVEIIEAVGSEHLGVFIDVINPISVLADPVETITRLAPFAPAGHVKDFRFASRYVPDRFHRTGFDVRWCYPGEGNADLGTLLGALLAAAPGPTFHLSIEGLDNRADVADQHERLTQSMAAVRAVVSAQSAVE